MARLSRLEMERKRVAKSRAVEEINPLKSRLLDVYNSLLREGCHKEADSLDRIIGRLEDWQERAKS